MFPMFLTLLVAATAAQSTIPPPADVAAAPAGAAKTPSGLASRILTPGTGKTHPTKTDLVTVNYTGWTTDGKMFDSSVTRGQPATFPLDRVIAGWTEGVQLMVTGEKRRFWIPEALAYRASASRRVCSSSMSSDPSPSRRRKAARRRRHRRRRDAHAQRAAHKRLQEGTGGRHPKPSSQVPVNYSGWTTDGKLFDSSVVRGQPITFGLDGVIPGWTEGLQLMFEGEKARFWIPEKLAYKGQSPPYGTLVCDVELIKIQ
jgi:peptidylprolyl isomerase